MKRYTTARDGRIRPDYLDDEFVEKIEAIMPHGSGINYEYQIVGTKDRFYVYHAYDYINEYIYIFPVDNKPFELDKIVIESAFEHPNEISLINGTETPDSIWLDENEYLLSEDMIGQIKEIIYKRDLIDTVRETDEIPNAIKY